MVGQLIHGDLPKELMLQLKGKYALEDFIETGTYQGGTAVWAAAHFDRVTTIEFSRSLYEETKAQHDRTSNLSFLFGDSREALRAIVPTLHQPAIFWLDSHCSGGQTYRDRKSTRLNSSPVRRSYADFCFEKTRATHPTSPPGWHSR